MRNTDLDGEEWKDAGRKEKTEGDGRLPFGKRAQKWFRWRVTSTLVDRKCEAGESSFYSYAPDLRAMVVGWYCERAETYRIWNVFPAYKGPGFLTGYWALREELVLLDFAVVLKECIALKKQRDDAARFPTLDEWLAADIKGALLHKGAAGGHLHPSWAPALSELKRHRQRNNPRECSACGKSFKEHNLAIRRCQRCRKRAKALAQRKEQGTTDSSNKGQA